MSSVVSSPKFPKIIRLEDEVINQIAAGEVIQRPCNAVKELMENSVDSGATIIQISIRDGGLKSIQIRDNGSGVQSCDMPLLCERFTTSKLKEVGDLLKITTLGFRGEALSSISHVSKLTVTSRTADSECAYKGEYFKGKLTGEVKLCAGNIGTCILVEDLFFNVPKRQRILRSSGEESNRIYSFVSKYSILYSGVSICLRKNDEVVLQTPGNCSPFDNIGLVYGAGVLKDLTRVSGGVAEENSPISETNFSFDGFFANTSYSLRKNAKIFFVNSRLVEIPKLKRVVDDFYAPLLSKRTHPFVFCSVRIAPHSLDVNVHPSKETVNFLFEEEIVGIIKQQMEEKLLEGDSAANSRLFFTNTPPLKLFPLKSSNQILDRSDLRSTKLDAYVSPNTQIRSEKRPSRLSSSDSRSDLKPDSSSRAEHKSESVGDTSMSQSFGADEELSSVLELRDEFKSQREDDLCSILCQSTFCGIVDERYCVTQHRKTLFMLDVRVLSQSLFYQTVLDRFGELPQYFLPSCPLISDLIGDFDDSSQIVDLLSERSAMLLEYFSIHIDHGRLLSLPLLLPDYVPPMSLAGEFIRAMAFNVNWVEEKLCFATIATAIAEFYALTRPESYGGDVDFDFNHFVEFSLFPALKKCLVVGGNAMRSAFTNLYGIHELYKQFERC